MRVQTFQKIAQGHITQSASDLGQTQYGYDLLGRLTSATPDQNLQNMGVPQESHSAGDSFEC